MLPITAALPPFLMSAPPLRKDRTESLGFFQAVGLRAERFAYFLMTACGIWIALVGIAKAYSKRLWLDEIMGLLIAKLADPSAIWRIVRTGPTTSRPSIIS